MNPLAPKERQASRWREFLKRLAAVDDALNTSHDELQDRRIARLEADLNKLRAQISSDSVAATK